MERQRREEKRRENVDGRRGSARIEGGYAGSRQSLFSSKSQTLPLLVLIVRHRKLEGHVAVERGDDW